MQRSLALCLVLAAAAVLTGCTADSPEETAAQDPPAEPAPEDCPPEAEPDAVPPDSRDTRNDVDHPPGC